MREVCVKCGYYLDDKGHCHECTGNLIEMIGRSEMKKNYDPVEKPVHYNTGGIEAIDAIMAATNDLSEGYLQGNILKYVWRYRYKNQIEDLKKARWYLNKLIEIYERK
jgi:hypothetical protein